MLCETEQKAGARQIRAGWAPIAITVMLLSLPQVALGQQRYDGSFGFSFAVEDGWLVLTKEEVMSFGESMESADSTLTALNPALRQRVIPQIKAGQIDILFRSSELTSTFVDNINFVRSAGNVPTAQQVSRQCGQLGTAFSQQFGRPVELAECRLKTVAGRDGLYIDSDGAAPGTRMIQAHVQVSPNVTVVLTASAKNSSIEVMRADFQALLDSITWD